MVSYGMNPVDLFEANDLFESGNMTQVQVSLLALAGKVRPRGRQGRSCGPRGLRDALDSVPPEAPGTWGSGPNGAASPRATSRARAACVWEATSRGRHTPTPGGLSGHEGSIFTFL